MKWLKTFTQFKSEKMVKVFISQPMRGKSEEEILEQRKRALKESEEHYPNSQILDS